ncbi:MAG TPA: HutD family protein [Steroidobacteraceae bacterium]|nr:HutD family protein [Steroidobacteraceae bacterium]
MQVIRHGAFKSLPWRNGGGVTHEAIRVPERGEPFRWRLSVAHIEASGPFSDFTGYRRTMVLLRGGGVALRFADGSARELRAQGDLIEFDGALAVECELLKGPCWDLNLIAAAGLGALRTRVQRMDGPLRLPSRPDSSGAGSTLVFPVDAALEVQAGADGAVLEPWDLAVLDGTCAAGGVHLESRGGAPGIVFLAALP